MGELAMGKENLEMSSYVVTVIIYSLITKMRKAK